jgi:pSer/pThr/pTyr-binding forkhead associated (FHA) protein
LVFETFLKEGCDKITSKSIYIFRLQDKFKFKVGRGHDVEFHIDDISVSRKHCDIHIFDDNVYIVDEKSKFGTQVI